MPQVHAVSALTKFPQVREEEIGQRNWCTFKARLPYAGTPARKPHKRGYILDINGRQLRQADKGRRAK